MNPPIIKDETTPAAANCALTQSRRARARR